MKFKHAIATVGFVLLSGCTAITPLEKQYSGFLNDYSNMNKVEVEDGSDALGESIPQKRNL